ncbi:MAG: glutamate--tRNA ligase [Acidimicrobiales bacterium]
MSSPRVRFAPAPTGYLHVGSARAALFNWMFARSTGGTFVLRIEDTDSERSRDDLVAGIERSLRWLGLDWDEGPIRQSSRRDRYLEVAGQLLERGLAYRCPLTSEELATLKADGRPNPYRSASADEGALRFATPAEGSTQVHDLIRGDVSFSHEDLEDFVLVRSDGTPGFLLSNAVDDHDMSISHVIRGEDLLPSTPRVLLVRHTLGWTDDPVFAHLPVIVNEKRQKLSKRRDDVALEDYRERGYLPEALRNYLALLGWAPSGDQEVMPMTEMVAEFQLSDVKSAPAFFDVAKLDHINGDYLRAMDAAEFTRRCLPWLETTPLWPAERFVLAQFQELAPLVRDRVRTLSEAPDMVAFLFTEGPMIDDVAWTKAVARMPAAGPILTDALREYSQCPWAAADLHGVTLAIAAGHQLKLGKAQAPIRVAVTGALVGPPLFESLTTLGREVTLERLQAALVRLRSDSAVERRDLESNA